MLLESLFTTVFKNECVYPVFILYLCVCFFMFMWHMGLATDSKMSIKFYLLTYLLWNCHLYNGGHFV